MVLFYKKKKMKIGFWTNGIVEQGHSLNSKYHIFVREVQNI